MARRYVNLRRIRERLGLDQEEFAKRFPVDVRTIRRWERDEVRPSPMALQRIKEIAKQARVELQQVDDARDAIGEDVGQVLGDSKPKRRINGESVNGEPTSPSRFSFLSFTPPRDFD